jgi:hypothetical protein
MGQNQASLPFMYQDISEGKFVQWSLIYTFPLIIAICRRFPSEKAWVRPARNVDPAAWVMGNVVKMEDDRLMLPRKSGHTVKHI